VRLGTNSSDNFLKLLNEKNQIIQKAFLEKIKDLTKTITIKGMLGDSTIADQETFDPRLVQEFYKKIIDRLTEWNIQDISISNNDDLRRIFVKFDIKEGNYLISCHISIQFHVLLFYKPDNKVIEYQKELSDIIEKTKDTESKLADDSDQLILEKLKELGYTDLEHKELFQIFYEDDSLREKIYKQIGDQSDVDVQNLLKRKKDLFNELDNLLMEIYHISPVLIDDARLVTGEEGCLFILDLEHFKTNVKEGMFDPKKIPVDVKEKLSNRLDEIIKSMNV
jgi:actin-related protein